MKRFRSLADRSWLIADSDAHQKAKEREGTKRGRRGRRRRKRRWGHVVRMQKCAVFGLSSVWIPAVLSFQGYNSSDGE